MSSKKMRLLIAVLTAVTLLVSVSVAFADHSAINVTLKDANNVPIPVAGDVAYSPKVSCGGCHFDCATGAYSTVKTTWCDGTAGKLQRNCATTECPDYESAARTTVTKSTTAGPAFDVTVPMHGVSTGKHATLGRNEGLVAAQRTAWSAPASITGPGMFGRF